MEYLFRNDAMVKQSEVNLIDGRRFEFLVSKASQAVLLNRGGEVVCMEDDRGERIGYSSLSLSTVTRGQQERQKR